MNVLISFYQLFTVIDVDIHGLVIEKNKIESEVDENVSFDHSLVLCTQAHIVIHSDHYYYISISLNLHCVF